MRPFTMATAAVELGVSRRRLDDLVVRFPKFHYSNGNRRLFTQDDIENLRAALRVEGAKKWQGLNSASTSRRSGKSGERISGAPWKKVQELLTGDSLNNSSTSSKRKSNVVTLRRKAKHAPTT